MLKQRILTALILAPLALLSILYLPLHYVPYLMAGVIGLAAYEWAGFCGISTRAYKVVLLSLFALTCVAINVLVPIESIWQDGRVHPMLTAWLGLAAGWWLIALWMIWVYPRKTRYWRNSFGLRALFGIFTLLPTFIAMNVLRAYEYEVDPLYGASLIFYVFGIVWSADIGAFFAGVKFGKHKLRPHVSPGKTMEGLAGGLIASMAIIFFASVHFNVTNALLVIHFSLGLMTVFVSALGDLSESMLKRVAGIKDSGRILPGHGGVMDRIDSLTAALPVFTLGFIWWIA